MEEKHIDTETSPEPASDPSPGMAHAKDAAAVQEAGVAAGQASAVPDGGRQAWLVVAGSVVTLVHSWGLVSTFGVFQTYYETKLLTSRSSSDISWIGSSQAALLMMGGTVAGPLYDAGYLRELILAGNLFVVLGMFMTSLCTQYYQVVLAQGITVGLGCAVMFLPSAAVVSQWFARRRSLALGVQSAGSPLAGIVLPIIFSRLEPAVGFGWATRVIAFILLALSVIPIVFVRTRTPPPTAKRAIFDRTALTDAPFLAFCGAMFFTFVGLYVPFFYAQLYAIDYSVSSEYFSPYFVTILNVGSVFGRLIPNYIADLAGTMNVLITCSALSALMAFVWMAVRSFPGMILFCILYGAFSGGVVSIAPSAIVPYCPDMRNLGTRMGMVFSFSGIAVLVGSPIGGAILRKGGDEAWRSLIVYSGTSLVVATLLFALATWLKRRSAEKTEKP